MKVLAIETSCDETGLALVEGQKTQDGFAFVVHKAALLSQAHLHAEYGGVYPTLAKREHEKNLPLLYEQFKDEPCDAVAVTTGPGLEPALWQGIEFAKKIAADKKVPLIPVNHMEGHLLSSLVRTGRLEHIQPPVLALLISGGHTEFVLMSDWFSYKVLGSTLDDAVGEAFDKVARMLGLPYPGGPEISKLATQYRGEQKLGQKNGLVEPTQTVTRGPFSEQVSATPKLPRPMLNSGTCDFSFSGLKTAALYALRGKTLSAQEKSAFAAEFEDAVADVFVAKTHKALIESDAKTFVIGGGVAANRYIREKLEQLVLDEFPDVELRLPELSITGDNAIMIAQAALARALGGKHDANPAELRAVGNLSIAS